MLVCGSELIKTVSKAAVLIQTGSEKDALIMSCRKADWELCKKLLAGKGFQIIITWLQRDCIRTTITMMKNKPIHSIPEVQKVLVRVLTVARAARHEGLAHRRLPGKLEEGRTPPEKRSRGNCLSQHTTSHKIGSSLQFLQA